MIVQSLRILQIKARKSLDLHVRAKVSSENHFECINRLRRSYTWYNICWIDTISWNGRRINKYLKWSGLLSDVRFHWPGLVRFWLRRCSTWVGRSYPSGAGWRSTVLAPETPSGCSRTTTKPQQSGILLSVNLVKMAHIHRYTINGSIIYVNFRDVNSWIVKQLSEWKKKLN